MKSTLCLTFDNLGEAAEIGAGALAADAPGVGAHPTATEVVPRLLERLDAHGLRATFFIEGLNAELYPRLLQEIDARGHEVGFHAWAHERWGELDATAQTENLAKGIAAFERLGLAPEGMRPPGGALGAGGVGAIRAAGLSYVSPAGSGAGGDAGVALLPFNWRHVDATCVLPPLGSVREQMTGSEEPIEPDRFAAYLGPEVGRLAADGGFATIVLHPFMLEWLGAERLETLLGRVAAAAADDGLWVAPCREVAARVLADPDAFEGDVTLDPTGWSG